MRILRFLRFYGFFRFFFNFVDFFWFWHMKITFFCRFFWFLRISAILLIFTSFKISSIFLIFAIYSLFLFILGIFLWFWYFRITFYYSDFFLICRILIFCEFQDFSDFTDFCEFLKISAIFLQSKVRLLEYCFQKKKVNDSDTENCKFNVWIW